MGIDYPNKRGPSRRFELALCTPGEPVELVPEPNNPADEHAIAVYSARGIQIGYLRSERAVLIGSYLRRGVEVQAIFQGVDGKAAWCRVAFNGETPTLPPRHEAESTDDEDSGFWPDPDYDEG